MLMLPNFFFQFGDNFLLNLPSHGILTTSSKSWKKLQFDDQSNTLGIWRRQVAIGVFSRSWLSFLVFFLQKLQCISRVFSCCSLASRNFDYDRQSEMTSWSSKFWTVWMQQLRGNIRQFRQNFAVHEHLKLVCLKSISFNKSLVKSGKPWLIWTNVRPQQCDVTKTKY